MVTETSPSPACAMCCVSDAKLFPLPLVAFEHYLLVDDRASYPINFFFRLRFSGEFDRSALEAAAVAALGRHPLLRAVVRESKRNRFEWVPVDRPVLPIFWQAGAGPPIVPAGGYIDLRREIGLRIFIRQQEGRAELLLQMHHVCCDGLGAVRFLEDLLGEYHHVLTGPRGQSPLRPLDAGRLRVRGKFGMNAAKYLLRLHKELAGLCGAVEYFAHRPLALPPRENSPPHHGAPRPLPAICAHTCTESQTDKLRRAAREIGCTVNDLLLGDLFIALDEWTARHDPDSRTHWLRIMIPTNLRSGADAVMPAANVISMVFLDRKPHRFSSLQRLVGSVRWEMNYCKRWRLGLTMIHLIDLLRRFDGVLERILPTDRCLATAVLSNLSDPTQDFALPRRDGRVVAGNMTLEGFEVMPPLRPMTRASFGVTSYAGRLTVGLNYDPRYFTEQDGNELLGGFVQRIVADL